MLSVIEATHLRAHGRSFPHQRAWSQQEFTIPHVAIRWRSAATEPTLPDKDRNLQPRHRDGAWSDSTARPECASRHAEKQQASRHEQAGSGSWRRLVIRARLLSSLERLWSRRSQGRQRARPGKTPIVAVCLGYLPPMVVGNQLERTQERRRAVALARHYREQEGLGTAEIADRLGRSKATIAAYFYDPTGEKAGAVKARYQGICGGCGAPTTARNGKADAYRYCKRCHPGAIARQWTRELVREAMLDWQERYGALPSSYDWSRTHARRRGGEALARLDAGDGRQRPRSRLCTEAGVQPKLRSKQPGSRLASSTASGWPSRTGSGIGGRRQGRYGYMFSEGIVVEPFARPLEVVRRVLDGADEALLCVAFVQQRGVNLIERQLAALGRGRLVCTTVFATTRPATGCRARMTEG